MLDTLLDQFSEMLLLAAEAAGDESGTCGESEGNGVNRRFDVAEGHAFRFHADATGGRGLASGKAVDLVVHNDVEQVDVAAHGVDEMVAADPETVTIASGHQNSELVVGEL